jgi:hypothetical protein
MNVSAATKVLIGVANLFLDGLQDLCQIYGALAYT